MRFEPLSLRFLENFDPHPDRSANAREKRFLCPLCGDAKPRDGAHRSLSANTQSGVWVCHRCGERGKLVEWHEKTFLDARVLRRTKLRRAFALDGGATRAARVSEPDTTKIETPETISGGKWRVALRDLQPLVDTAGASYLKKRAISSEVATAAGTRFSPSWFGRAAVVFPLRDAQNALVAAQGRYISDGRGPKARTSGDKKAGVFATAHFFENLQRGAPIVIVEAPIDALSLAMCGFPAMALCGKDGWPVWLPIKCAFHRVALAFDADAAGDVGAEKLARVLQALARNHSACGPKTSKIGTRCCCKKAAKISRTGWRRGFWRRRER